MFKNVYKNDPMKREQHEAVRKTAGWYYFTHQLLEISGKDATALLDRVYPNPIATLKNGGARYTTMLNEDGLIIDDVVIFRLEENKYWISTLFVRKLIAWLDAHKGESKVEYKNITDVTDMYAVQGPKSRDLLNAILAEKVDDQKFFTIRENKIGDVPVKISRAGFTGEKIGYEIYVAPEQKGIVEAKLAENEKAFGALRITEFQIMVLTLATEKGFYLMCDIGKTNPFEVGLDRGINWDKDFIGKEALLKVKAEGAKRQLLGFTVDEDDVFIASKDKGGVGDLVIVKGEEVGRVTKCTYGFTVGKNIGYALVESAKTQVGDTAVINGYTAVLTDRVFV
ncbi:MAG: aminomethyltransferase family protein [Spirochaetales bacterium]|jgi:aminomethyltransferase|nr:aminomethyltransferase family protein [Spirochaetales bacterium]